MIKKLLKTNSVILLVLILILVKELLFVMVIPLWQNHDELEHFAYTYYLVEEKAIPKSTARSHLELTLSPEMEQADKLLESNKISFGVFEKNQLIHQDFSQTLRHDQATDKLNNLSRRVDTSNYKNVTANYSPFYYSLEAIPYRLFYIR